MPKSFSKAARQKVWQAIPTSKTSHTFENLQVEKQRKVEQDNAFTRYIKKMLKNPEVLHEWSDTIWMTVVEKALIHKNKNITFDFTMEK